MKAIKKIIITILILGLALSLFACKDTTQETVTVESKPAFNAALNNYENLENRGSEFVGKFIFTLYGATYNTTDSDGNVITNQNIYTIGQQVTFKRIKNNGKIYIEGELSSCDVSDNIAAVFSIFSKDNSKPNPNNNENDEDNEMDPMTLMKKYLDGELKVNFKIGYDGNGNYNLKTNIEDINSYWAGTNQDSIDNLLDEYNYNGNFDISQLLMFSTYIDPEEQNWIDKDTASKFWSEPLNAYNYEMCLNDEQLLNTIFGELDAIANAFDNTIYEDDIEKYNKYIGYVRNWCYVGDNGIAATVDENSYPIDMTTSATIYANIDINELLTILADTLSERDFIDTKNIINIAALILKGVNGEENKIGMSFQILLDEKYFYDDESLNLDNVDPDMFSDCTVENERDDTFIYHKKPKHKEDDNTDSEIDNSSDETDNSNDEIDSEE